MVVDDSIVIRGLISRWLNALDDIEVVAACRNGQDAVDQIAKANVDLVVLDIEMPVMDGLTALPLLLKAAPGVRVLMASTLTRRNADISMKALALGATDYVPKPEATKSGHASAEFQEELINRIRAIGGKKIGLIPRPIARGGIPAPTRSGAASGSAAGGQGSSIETVPASRIKPKVLAIGSSTGGPKALFEVFEGLKPVLAKLPVVVTQHMPPTFTAILAEHIAGVTGGHCVEGADGMKVEAGNVYIAPGGKHMLLKKRGMDVVIKLDDGEPVNFCKPAVDPMLESMVSIYGAGILSCILTGMGHDGCDGARKVQSQGGTVIAQDEASSVVWGMPGAVAQAGICHKVVPLGQVAKTLVTLINGGLA
ncbi:MAG: chemotaxis response regulator protein-glutamate methylesterase [Parvibaculaceae bacterium]|nr:chemotaxis response regulator protein-glutamate methylesterase [Parvibaculaceae bacterium]